MKNEGGMFGEGDVKRGGTSKHLETNFEGVFSKNTTSPYDKKQQQFKARTAADTAPRQLSTRLLLLQRVGSETTVLRQPFPPVRRLPLGSGFPPPAVQETQPTMIYRDHRR